MRDRWPDIKRNEQKWAVRNLVMVGERAEGYGCRAGEQSLMCDCTIIDDAAAACSKRLLAQRRRQTLLRSTMKQQSGTAHPRGKAAADVMHENDEGG